MPYYIGDVIKDDNRLVARTPEKFRESGIEVRLQTRVDEIDADEKVVRLSDGTILAYDTLVFGTGTTPFVPAIPGLDLAYSPYFGGAWDVIHIAAHALIRKI